MKKRILSTLLALCMVLALLPGGLAMAAGDATTGLSLEQLQEKFPSGKYWNGGDPDSYTSSPCECKHRYSHTKGSSEVACTCNSFWGSIQCAGFALKVLYDAYGQDCTEDWTKETSVSYLANVKPGDYIRYSGHSVVVVKVDGDMITVGECNWDSPCKINWERTENRSHFKTGFSHIYVAPYELPTTSEHIHNFSTTEYEAAHPHREYRKCSCGAVEYTGRNLLVNSCDQCYPGKYTVSGQIYCVYEDGTECLVQSGEVTLYTSGRSYTLEIRNGSIVPNLLVAAGTYAMNITCPVRNSPGLCVGKIEEEIQINKNTDLGQIKIPFYILHHQINVSDAVTEEPLSGFSWTLWEGDQQKEAGTTAAGDDGIQPSHLRIGSDYTLEIYKDGYLDFSTGFTPFIPSLGGEAVARTDVYLQPTRGDCGNGVQWKFEDGVLTFWGNGPIPDNPTVPPWGELGSMGLIEHVEIMPGITRIGDRMMYGRWDYEGITVSIPDTVTSIGKVSLAFTYLHYVEIPASVRSIEFGAFDCSKDLTIKFMGDAPELDERVFDRCTGITVLYPAGNSTWDKYIGQNLGAEDTITWQPYGAATVVPTPTPAPSTPVTPAQPAASGKPTEADTPEAPAATFADVSVGSWYYEAVAYVSTKGLMKGVTSAAFAPNADTNRAMIWTILARMSGQNVDGGAPWYVMARDWAMTTGVSDGTAPNDSVTREQLAAMLYRYAGSPDLTDAQLAALSQYPDRGSVSAYAEQAMAWAVSNGVVLGIDGKLAPEGSATRAQVATMLMRFCQLTDK